MKVSKSDRQKVIGLAVVLVAIWVFVGLRYVRLSDHWEAKMEEEHRQHQQAAAEAGGEELSPAARLASMVKPVEPPIRDPFHPRIMPRSRGASVEEPTEEDADIAVPDPSNGNGRMALHVTGILLGEPNAAVLRLGERHFVVQEGDSLGNGLQVGVIERNQVTIKGRRSSYVLRLGR